MSASPEVRELAAMSAAEIRRRGWTQGAMAESQSWFDAHPDEGLPENWYENCAVCALGGIAAAETGYPLDGWRVIDSPNLYPDASELAKEIVKRVGLRGHNGITKWNDRNTTTASQVLAVFDLIAAGN